MLVEIVKGFFCDPEGIAVVKATGKQECAVFTVGQSAMDGGFHLPHSARLVTNAINAAIDEGGEDDGEEEDDGDENEDENEEED